MTPTDPFAGRILGGCRLERPLGRGGMGVVYLATHLGLGTPVAVKILQRDMGHDEERLERFLQEARILARFSHPGVVRILDAGTSDASSYLVMEYVPGESLADSIGRRGSLDPYEAAWVARSLAFALAHVHGRGIVHRDLKTANVFLSFESCQGEGNAPLPGLPPGWPSVVKLGDFGLARMTEMNRRLTQAGAVVGTVHYLSPEQVDGEPGDAASDFYALGVVLFRILTLKWPHPGDDPTVMLRHIRDSRALPLDEFLPRAPREMVELVAELLARDPSSRPASAIEIAARLDRVLLAKDARLFTLLESTTETSGSPRLEMSRGEPEAGSASPAGSVAPAPPAGKTSGRHRTRWRAARRPSWALPAAALAIVGGAALAAALLSSGSGDSGPAATTTAEPTARDAKPSAEKQGPDRAPARDPDPNPHAGSIVDPAAAGTTPVAGDPDTIWTYVEELRARSPGSAEVEERVRSALQDLLVAHVLKQTKDLSRKARLDPTHREEHLARALALLRSVENPAKGRALPPDLRTPIDAEIARIEGLR